MLVVPGVPHGDGPHEGGVVLTQVLLHRRRQLQVLRPVGVLQAAAVGADHEGHLGGVDPRHAADHLDHVPLPVGHRVPVDVQDDGDGGVLLQVALDGLQGPVVGPAVLGVVVEGLVVDDGEPRLLQGRRQLPAHPHRVVLAVRGAVLAAGDVLLALRHGVGLAAVGMYDEDLGALLRQGRVEGPVKEGGVKALVRAVVDVHVPGDHVPLGGGGHQGPGWDPVVGKNQWRSRVRRLLLDGDGGGPGLILSVFSAVRPLIGVGLILAPQLPDGLPAPQEQRALADGQGHRGGDRVQLPPVGQLVAQNGQGHVPLPPQGLEGRLGGGAGGGDRHCPQHPRRHQQGGDLPPPGGGLGPALDGHGFHRSFSAAPGGLLVPSYAGLVRRMPPSRHCALGKNRV